MPQADVAGAQMLLLIVLQVVQVAILWVHDWLPMGSLNDIEAVQARDTRSRLIRITLIQSLPFTIGLLASITYVTNGRPHWLWNWLWIRYGTLFAGELRAWWWPYLFQRDSKRAERYRAMFGRTTAFLPQRNGIVPNTLHTILHTSTAATLIVLCLKPC